MNLYDIKDYELQNILGIHYSKRHKDIRTQYSKKKKYICNSYFIEKNLKNIEKSIKERTNENLFIKILAVAEMIGCQYRYIYPNEFIDRVIKNNLFGIINESFNEKKQAFYNNFSIKDKEIFIRKFDKNFFYEDKKLKLSLYLNENNRVVVKEAFYKIDEYEIFDLKNDFDGMTLEQISVLLGEFKLFDVKKLVDIKNREVIYKTEVIDDIYRYIMLYIMYREPSIYGAKRALIFAADFKADLTIPIRYALSTNDNNIDNTLKYYYMLNGEDTYFYPNYFENLNKFIKSKKSIMLSEIKSSSSKRRKR